MNLVGFKARNHPQQTADADVDDRAITPGDFTPLHERFQFTIDAAATPANARLPRFWTKDDDALSLDWFGERVWCNPPYSSIEPWVIHANRMSTSASLIVMLLPANRTEQGWWQRHIEPVRGLGGCRPNVEFLPGRMRFLRNGATDIKPNERPPFGCCLVIWRTP